MRLIWDAAHGLHWIARQLGRTPQATYQRALRIGLPCGCPQGYEYLTASAKRCGYTVPQLRQRLAWAGFKVHAALCWAHGHVCKRTHVVDPQDVDDALERWHRTETRDAAARRVGIDRVTLTRRLARLGIVPTYRLRVTPEQVQQALALRFPGAHLRPQGVAA